MVGWTGLVGDQDNDEMLLRVLHETLVKDVDLKQAVESVMIAEYESLYYPTIMTYHSMDEEEMDDAEKKIQKPGKKLTDNLGPSADNQDL